MAVSFTRNTWAILALGVATMFILVVAIAATHLPNLYAPATPSDTHGVVATSTTATTSNGSTTVGSTLNNAVAALSGSLAGTKSGSTGSASVMAWLYPSKTQCSAQSEYSDGRTIQFLKPEYFTVAYDGTLTLLTQAKAGCNGYSAANVASVRAHSTYQYVTVSSGVDSMQALTATEASRQAAISTLTNFATTNQVTGIEVDFEDFGSWDQPTYQNYLTFLNELGTSLHSQGKKLMVDVPPISNASEQNYYLLTYSDIAKTPADYIVVMAYDYQFDQGSGTPIAPNSWVVSIIQNAEKSISTNRLVIGMPSYAYSGVTDSFHITRKTYTDVSKINGFASASRDASSGERIFTNGNTSYVYVDSQTLDAERALIESHGIKYISVWALGGNAWF